MRRILLASLFTVLLSTSVFSDISPDTTTVPSTTSESTSTTVVTTTTPQTTTPETTTEQPTTTTKAPVTTTTTPETTINTTTTSSTTSTTPATTTSTTTNAPTTKAPEPTPPDTKLCSFSVMQNNVTCIIAKMEVLFTIEEGSQKSYIAVTQNATTDGSDCHLSNITQSLVLSETNYILTMFFEKSSDKAYVKNITFSYASQEEQVEVHYLKTDELFPVKVGNSYLCHSEEKVQLGTAANVTMQIIDIQIQSFGSTGKAVFGSVEECDNDSKITDAVPIAVACALIALIVVVLIAYLVGRQRSRQRGYQSV